MASVNLMSGSIVNIISYGLRCWALKLELELRDHFEKKLEAINEKRIARDAEIEKLRAACRFHDADKLVQDAAVEAIQRSDCIGWLSYFASRGASTDGERRDVHPENSGSVGLGTETQRAQEGAFVANGNSSTGTTEKPTAT